MRTLDVIHFTWQALTRHLLRSSLMLTAMTIGVAAIVVLTALGDGARQYVVNEFASLGTNLIIIIPGKSETTGGAPNIFSGETPRDLTTGDAGALKHLANVNRVAPVVIGSAKASWQGVERDSPIVGSTHELLGIRHWKLSAGRFLPKSDMDRSTPVCVIGSTIKKEIFGATNPLGQWLRIGEYRFRVIGILASEGRSIGVDVQELVVIPVASAQALFNTYSMFRILVEAKHRSAVSYTIEQITEIIANRHQGEEDVTIITQDAVLQTFDKIFSALTYTLAGIAGISLAVAGILIMNIMLVSVSQRTAEIGLLKALGGSRKKIIYLFLTEATLLAGLGAVSGLALGEFANLMVRYLYPAFPMGTPLWASLGAIAVAVISGVVFGAMPAHRAADLNPIEALAHR